MADSLIVVQDEPRGPSQLIEVPVSVNGLQRIQFPDIQQLRSQGNQYIVTKEIRVVVPAVLTNGPITGFATAPITELQKISLVIYCEGWEKAQYLPILFLNDVFDPVGTTPHVYKKATFANWLNIDWSKTFLQYSNGTSSAGQPYAVLLDVVYQKFDSVTNQIIVGAS